MLDVLITNARIVSPQQTFGGAIGIKD